MNSVIVSDQYFKQVVLKIIKRHDAIRVISELNGKEKTRFVIHNAFGGWLADVEVGYVFLNGKRRVTNLSVCGAAVSLTRKQEKILRTFLNDYSHRDVA